MAKPENGSFWRELLSAGLYKRNQGRLARQLTAAGIGALVIAGAYILSQGPLGGLVNASYRVIASYAGQEDPAKDKALAKLADENGAAWVTDSVGSDRREIEFHVPTSRMWRESPQAMNEGKQKAEKLKAAIKQEVDSVKVGEPQRVSSRAVWVIVGIPVVICAICGWVIYRVVNYAPFAEFLISVEAEMGKVSWASKQELYRATVVVLSTMFFLGVVLFAYDVTWKWILQAIGVLRFS
ncbi:MAG TPA: preprotein translocase subunit SecE [Planctomycetaceae bacterium]|nr:preprotein translocase subunit SecE [Planctomycetaceae bacterium]